MHRVPGAHNRGLPGFQKHGWIFPQRLFYQVVIFHETRIENYFAESRREKNPSKTQEILRIMCYYFSLKYIIYQRFPQNILMLCCIK